MNMTYLNDPRKRMIFIA